MNTNNEIWRDIDDSDIHQISNLGRFRNKTTGRIIKQSKTKKGYSQCFVIKNYRKKGFTIKTHSLVMLAFKPERPKGYTIDHIDGNKDNNKITNLQYVTNRYNTVKQKVDTNSKPFPCVQSLPNGTYRVEYRFKGLRVSKLFKTAEEGLLYYYNEMKLIDKSVSDLLFDNYKHILI